MLPFSPWLLCKCSSDVVGFARSNRLVGLLSDHHLAWIIELCTPIKRGHNCLSGATGIYKAPSICCHNGHVQVRCVFIFVNELDGDFKKQFCPFFFTSSLQSLSFKTRTTSHRIVEVSLQEFGISPLAQLKILSWQTNYPHQLQTLAFIDYRCFTDTLRIVQIARLAIKQLHICIVYAAEPNFSCFLITPTYSLQKSTEEYRRVWWIDLKSTCQSDYHHQINKLIKPYKWST